MAYAVQQDIVDRYGEDELYATFDRDNDGTLDTNAVDKALQDASDEIDGYLLGIIGSDRLPLSDPPKILVFQCIDIALYKGSVGAAISEEKRQRYEDAVKFLTMISKGSISIGLQQPDEGGIGGSVFSGNDRIFTRDKMKGIL